MTAQPGALAVSATTATLNAEVVSVEEVRNLSTADVLKVAGCTYRQLDYWCRSYALCAADRGEDGSGHPRWFTQAEATTARTIRVLGEAGVNVGLYARAVVETVRALPGTTYLLLSRDEVTAFTDSVALASHVVAAKVPVTVVRVAEVPS